MSSQTPSDNIIDLEQCAAEGRRPTQEGPYRVRIDRERHLFHDRSPTGAEILAAVGKAPAEFALFQRIRGQGFTRIEPVAAVDLTVPGVERFVTHPVDCTHAVTILVNRHDVEMPTADATGLEIKQAAIEQGVMIQPDFALFKIVGGKQTPIRDDESVTLCDGDEFRAIAPDDNS